jgi:hypothetical protein
MERHGLGSNEPVSRVVQALDLLVTCLRALLMGWSRDDITRAPVAVREALQALPSHVRIAMANPVEQALKAQYSPDPLERFDVMSAAAELGKALADELHRSSPEFAQRLAAARSYATREAQDQEERAAWGKEQSRRAQAFAEVIAKGNLSVEAAASIAGVSRGTVQTWLRCGPGPRAKVAEILRHVGLPLDTIELAAAATHESAPAIEFVDASVHQ